MVNDGSALDFSQLAGVIVYGTGKDGSIVKDIILKNYTGKVLFCDSIKTGTFMGETIIAPLDILDYPEYTILIASRRFEKEIYITLLEMLIPAKKIFSLRGLIDKVKQANQVCINGLDIEMAPESTFWADKLNMYDRFLPILAGIIKGGYIVDIGANVGDTAAWMLPFTSAMLLCIEPQDRFYSMLMKNIDSFPPDYSNRVITKKCLISDDTQGAYSLACKYGTAHMIRDNNSSSNLKAIRLDDALAEENIQLSDVSLIKCDTDGNDFHCLMSLGEKLKDVSPILYFENDLTDGTAFDGFNTLNEYLQENDYNDFWFFDNFGNYLGHGSHDVYQSLNQYLKRMLIYNTSRTFWYVDILAAKADKAELCLEAVHKWEDKFSVLS